MKRISLRIPDKFHERLKFAATVENRSVNGQIIQMLSEAFRERGVPLIALFPDEETTTQDERKER